VEKENKANKNKRLADFTFSEIPNYSVAVPNILKKRVNCIIL
jgi:hypothetical protein